jgi:integrase
VPLNPVRDLEKPIARVRTELEVFTPEDVWVLVRAAESEQDAAIFTAAFTGLRRGELVALPCRNLGWGRAARAPSTAERGVERGRPLAPRLSPLTSPSN